MTSEGLLSKAEMQAEIQRKLRHSIEGRRMLMLLHPVSEWTTFSQSDSFDSARVLLPHYSGRRRWCCPELG